MIRLGDLDLIFKVTAVKIPKLRCGEDIWIHSHFYVPDMEVDDEANEDENEDSNEEDDVEDSTDDDEEEEEESGTEEETNVTVDDELKKKVKSALGVAAVDSGDESDQDEEVCENAQTKESKQMHNSGGK